MFWVRQGAAPYEAARSGPGLSALLKGVSAVSWSIIDSGQPSSPQAKYLWTEYQLEITLRIHF